MKMERCLKLCKGIFLALAWIIAQSLSAQTITVSGNVSDVSGEPLIGVTIQVANSSVGTVTNFNGNYTLSGVSPNAVLEVSYVGMTTQRINVNGRTNIDIVMSEDTEILSEVVVTGFGLSQRKESLTSAISVIGAEDISRSQASTSSGALVGKIPGINSRQVDGRPGASTNIQIRNMGAPLYVIDGIQSDEGQFNNIDFNDIETITVLKDASASIYGVRAANGVVVVTTKKGSRNSKNTVTLNTYYGWQSLYAFPKPATAETYITNYIQSQTVQGATNYTYTKEDYEKWKKGTEKGYVPFDWYDFIWEVSPQTYVNANVSGGSENINYYLSVGNLKQDAMIVNYGGFQRTNVQMNVTANITDRFKVGGGMNGRIETRKNPGVPEVDDYWMPRFGTFRNLPTRRPFANDNPLYPTLTSTNPATNFGWLTYDLSGTFQNTWRVGQLNFDAEYELFDGLKAKGLFSYYLANQRLDNHEYTYKLYGYDEDTDTYPVIFENNNPYAYLSSNSL
jgi:TonB-linked SusC/RagA family outer membrane protein